MKQVAAVSTALWLCVGGCRGPDGYRAADAPDMSPRPASCPETLRVEPPLPNVAPEHRTAEYWIRRNAEYGPVDEPLLDADEVARHNLALTRPVEGEPIGHADLSASFDEEALAAQVEERLAYMREQLQAGTLVDEDGNELEGDALRAFASAPSFEAASLAIAADMVALRCGPYEAGLYRTPIDPDFDRNRCSTIREGELVQVLGAWPNGMRLARTSYAMGWIDGAGLSNPIETDEAKNQSEARRVLPLTRRALLTEAFSMLGHAYGWGGENGGYDCSRYLLELFSRFGLDLPRHSARQAMAGTFAVDVSTVEDLGEKRLLFEAAARRGIVLLQFPGHIMLYLGTTEQGVPMAIHAFSEFLTPCGGTDFETVNRVDRVAVSDLSLGERSSRQDFLSRVTTMTVIGDSPGPALVANAKLRPSAPVSIPQGRCSDSERNAIFESPHRPDTSRPLRVIASSERDPGAATLVLFAPDGRPVEPEQHVLDGPPFGRFIEVQQPEAGRWTAVLGDGDEVHACKRFDVAKRPAPTEHRSGPAPAWEVERNWGRALENLYSAFIEQLFREPIDDDTTWPNLQALIGDRERNLLYDYRAVGEDSELTLEPDCADLPYFLRAYFAWKLRLPFAYRMCSRGRRNRPPECEAAVLSNLDPVPDRTDTAAFRRFARRVANTVHSSSPRTLPQDDKTDFYPVRLSRQSMRPGTVYADPYGHVLVVARWQPQGVTDYGVLIGADAQPDGTVGRRRFWRGSFLFTPKTDAVGAGFKAWRPIRYDPALEVQESGTTSSPTAQPWRIPSNEALREAKGKRAWSDMQYRGTVDDFYSTMEGLINPRPLDAARMQVSLVDALEESVQRRLSSVQNGEDYMKAEGYPVIEMPHGQALFLTTGPWEDYSTPSRDMRLLISVDAVVSFPKSVAAHPERFGIREADREAAVEQVEAALKSELAKRTFVYTRSDGSPWQLTLADVVDRTKALEVAYNPNDCVEIRWAAPQDSEERATCKRRAPPDHQARMQQYRPWFAARERGQAPP
jgi:hypothetical protein